MSNVLNPALQESLHVQRASDGLLYMITDQEHADGITPTKDRLACMRCRSMTAELTLTYNGGGSWYYCAPCTEIALYGVGCEVGALAGWVRYVYRRPGSDRNDLSAQALALIDHWNRIS
jgi:hypothetical protein